MQRSMGLLGYHGLHRFLIVMEDDFFQRFGAPIRLTGYYSNVTWNDMIAMGTRTFTLSGKKNG